MGGFGWGIGTGKCVGVWMFRMWGGRGGDREIKGDIDVVFVVMGIIGGGGGEGRNILVGYNVWLGRCGVGDCGWEGGVFSGMGDRWIGVRVGVRCEMWELRVFVVGVYVVGRVW